MARGARGLSKIAYEEKGQRTARSTDVYLSKEGMKEVGVCTGCRAIYRNKRWYFDEDEWLRLESGSVKSSVVCPACRRMQDDNPAGIVTFTGEYLVANEEEILNTIKNTEQKARAKNPLSRVMEIKQEGNVLIVTTTEDKLAQKLGRDIYKAHSGKLEYQWSADNSSVRVNWTR